MLARYAALRRPVLRAGFFVLPEDFAALRAQFGGQLFQLVHGAGGNGHAESGFTQGNGAGAANAAARSRHDGGLPLELEIHVGCWEKGSAPDPFFSPAARRSDR